MISRRPSEIAAASSIALLLTFSASPLWATQVVRLETPELVQSSSDIVVGTVESTVSHWNEAHTHIVTDIRLRIEESLKGSGEPTLTLTQMGGDADGMHLEVAGSPAFRKGQRSVLFVWRDDRGHAQVNGLAQGKFDIERDEATGRLFVRRDPGVLALRDPKGGSLMRMNVVSVRVSLEDFKVEIRNALSAPAQPSDK